MLVMMLHRLKLSFQNKPLQSRRMFAAQFRAAALSFPSNLIVSLLPSDLWHFQHSSHLLLSHLPGSSPAALVSCRLPPQLLSLSLSDMIQTDNKKKEQQKEKEKGTAHFSVIVLETVSSTYFSLTMCVRSTVTSQWRIIWLCLWVKVAPYHWQGQDTCLFYIWLILTELQNLNEEVVCFSKTALSYYDLKVWYKVCVLLFVCFVWAQTKCNIKLKVRICCSLCMGVCLVARGSK